jgi:hypothetical protein
VLTGAADGAAQVVTVGGSLAANAKSDRMTDVVEGIGRRKARQSAGAPL